MGLLPVDTRCGWCGRRGAALLLIYVPLCAHGGIGDVGCLHGERYHDGVIKDALIRNVFCLRENAGDGCKPQALMFLAARLAPYLGDLYDVVDLDVEYTFLEECD